MPASPYPSPQTAPPTSRAGSAGLIVLLTGLALIVLSLFAVDWTETKFSDGGVTFFEVQGRVLTTNSQQVITDPNGFAVSYFPALGIGILIFVAVFSFVAILPGGGRGMRLLASITALLGAVLLGVVTAVLADLAEVRGGPVVAGAGYLTILIALMIGGGRR